MSSNNIDKKTFSNPEENMEKKVHIKGILRPPNNRKRRKTGILWDEKNIELCEAEKNSSDIIEEPKTPFHHGIYYTDSDEEEIEELECISGSIAKSHHVALHNALLNAKNKLENNVDNTNAIDGDNKNDDDDVKKQNRKVSFEQRRKIHYNEFIVAKNLCERDNLKNSNDSEVDSEEIASLKIS